MEPPWGCTAAPSLCSRWKAEHHARGRKTALHRHRTLEKRESAARAWAAASLSHRPARGLDNLNGRLYPRFAIRTARAWAMPPTEDGKNPWALIWTDVANTIRSPYQHARGLYDCPGQTKWSSGPRFLTSQCMTNGRANIKQATQME